MHTTTTVQKDEVTRRAAAAFIITDGIPERGHLTSLLMDVDDREYVVVRVDGTLVAVYRIRPSDGVLRRMKRWPRQLEK
jgi:hypothetical protein